MDGINHVFLVGRLGRDPDAHSTQGGSSIARFSVATNRRRNGDGEPEQITDWHRIVTFGKLADQCSQYLKRGRLVCVEGSLRTRTWERAPGEKQSTTEVVAWRVTFLDSKARSVEESGHGDEEGCPL